MSRNIEIRFVSDQFVIEEAQLFLYRIEVGRHVKTMTTATGENLRDSPSIPELRVIGGSVNASMDRPGIIEGLFFGLRIQRPSGGAAFYPIAEFSHEVTEEDWKFGITRVDMNTYRDVLVKARDPEGQPAVLNPMSLGRLKKAGCIEFQSDEHGEARLLLSAGRYSIHGMPIANFEVTSADSEKIVEVTLEARPQIPPTPEH